MKSIHDELSCESAASYFGKSSSSVEVKVGNAQSPIGCSWNDHGNLELFKPSSGDCNVNGYDGCFCKSTSGKAFALKVSVK